MFQNLTDLSINLSVTDVTNRFTYLSHQAHSLVTFDVISTDSQRQKDGED
jgi:hypothetical protein